MEWHSGKNAIADIMLWAEKTTKGSWMISGVRRKINKEEYHSIFVDNGSKQENIAIVWYDPKTHIGYHDANYIAAANPSALASISDYVKLLEAENEKLHEDIAKLNKKRK